MERSRRLALNQVALDAPPVALTPLSCSGCGGAVPLVDGDAVPCPYCRAQVELPIEYRRLRDAERADRQQCAIAADVLRHVGRAPPRWQRVCASIFTGPAILAGAYPAVIVLVVVLELVAAPWVSRLLRADVFDVLGGGPVEQLFDTVVGVGLATVLTWVGVYGSRRAVSVRGLQAALSARPPKRPGGPSECRSCGAPLLVRPEDEAVQCPYCRTENLVRIAWSWIRKAEKSAAALGASLESVRPAVEQSARGFRRALWLYGVGLLLFGGLLIGGTL